MSHINLNKLAPTKQLLAALRRPAKARPRKARGQGHCRRTMNKVERQYADQLAAQLARGEIQDYTFEAHTFDIAVPDEAQPTRWTPDFEVVLNDGTIRFVDVKGGRKDRQGRPKDEGAQWVKIRVAAERYWWYQFLVARKNQDGFTEEII